MVRRAGGGSLTEEFAQASCHWGQGVFGIDFAIWSAAMRREHDSGATIDQIVDRWKGFADASVVGDGAVLLAARERGDREGTRETEKDNSLLWDIKVDADQHLSISEDAWVPLVQLLEGQFISLPD
jgi:hypothetical protein